MSSIFEKKFNKKEQLVVVLSRNYSTGLSVIRALGSAGYTVDLVASALREGGSEGIASSRYVRNSVEVVSKKVNDGGDKALFDELIKYAGKNQVKPVLLPTDDFTASVMDSHRDALESIFVMPGIKDGGEGSLIHHMDKAVQGELARKAGVLTPKEWNISLKEDLVIPEDVVYPCFVKPAQSFLGYKQEMAKLDTKEDLEKHLMAMKEKFSDRFALVQEYLNIDNEIDIEGVCLGDKVILPGVIWKGYVAKYERGVPLAGKTVAFEELEGLYEQVYRLLKSYNYYGLFDLGINIVDGKYFFNEINLRSGGTNFVYFGSGVNLPDLFAQEILGHGHDEDKAQIGEFGLSYVYEKMAWDDYLHDYMTREEMERVIKKAEIAAYRSEDDPAPDRIFDREQEEAERKKKLRERREKCVATTMEATGWDHDYALEQIKDCRNRTHVSYNEYIKLELYKYTPQEQEAMLEDGLKKLALERALKAKAKYRNALDKDEESKALASINNLGKKLENQKADSGNRLVVILSRNYSTGISVIRSVGSAGFTVDLVASAFKEGRSQQAASSKYVRNHIELVSKKVKNGADAGLMGALMEYAGKTLEKPVLFPTDDYTASIMDMNRNTLKDVFIMPEIIGGRTGTMTKLMDKITQAELARKAGLLTPKDWIISLRKEDIHIPEDIQYPCFCKPIESITGYKREMAKCENEAELKRHLRNLRAKYSNRSVMVQEFLQIDNEIDLSGLCFDDEVIIPAIIKKTNVAQYEKGVTLSGIVVPFEELGELKDKVIDLMKGLHYKGMFDLELNIVGDKIYFNEINFRSGGPNYAYFASGSNLPGIFVKEAIGDRVDKEEAKVSEYGKSFIYEQVAWDDYIHGFMTKKELKECIAKSDVTLLCNQDDPEPGKIFMKAIKKRAFRVRVKGRLRNAKAAIKTALGPTLKKIKYLLLAYPQTKRRNRRNPDAERPRVIVTGRNYSTNLTIAKSLGEAGYEVEVLRIFQKRPKLRSVMKMLKPDAYSKSIKAYHVCVSNRKSERIVDRLIELADSNHKMLIIPADDLMAYILDDYYDLLKEYYYLPNVDDTEGAINRLMSKGVQKKLALKAGLPVLNSCVIRTEGGQFDIPETVTYPCFIKPNISKNSSKSKMKKCYSQEELRETLTEYSKKKDVEMLVEDFVEIKRECSILGLSTKDGVVGPGLFAALEGGQAEHIGVAVVGQLLDPNSMQPLVSNLINFVASLNFDGLYDIDLIETVDGKIYFVELNMRYGASGYAVTKGNANLPGMFADYMIYGTPIDMNCKVDNVGATFVSEKVLIEEYAMGRMTKSKLKAALKEADITFVKDETDPKAYRHFRKFFTIASIVRMIKSRK